MLYAYDNPEAAFIDTLLAEIARFPAGTTVGREFPSASIAAPHIQIAWDGTPSEEEQRELATMRVTVWGWTEQTSPTTSTEHRTEAYSLASLARAVLREHVDPRLWRVTKGAGRTPGVDDDTGLPFCTFTLTAETSPSAVA